MPFENYQGPPIVVRFSSDNVSTMSILVKKIVFSAAKIQLNSYWVYFKKTFQRESD